MSIKTRGLGFRDFQKDIRSIIRQVENPQSGISDVLEEAIKFIIIPEIEDNIYSLFDTSGDFPKHVKAEKINQFQVDLVVDTVYAAIQEYGGTIEVTEKARGFFWYKHSITDDDMWKALALSDEINIPARPYVRPALMSTQKEAFVYAARELGKRIAKSV